MKNQGSTIKLDSTTQVDIPADRHLVSLERRDWNRVKRKVGELNDHIEWWQNAMWFFAATFITLLISAYDTKDSFYFWFSVISFSIALVIYFFSRKVVQSISVGKKEIIMDIQEIEESFPVGVA